MYNANDQVIEQAKLLFYKLLKFVLISEKNNFDFDLFTSNRIIEITK